MFEDVKKQHKLNDNTKIFCINAYNHSPICVYGNQLFGESGIILSRASHDWSKDLLSMCLKHEAVHLKQNHMIKIPLFCLMPGLGTVAFCQTYKISPLITSVCTLLLTISAIFFYVRKIEIEADVMALPYESVEEMQRGMNLWEFLKNKFAPLHPSSAVRQDLILAELKKRGLSPLTPQRSPIFH